MGEQNVEQEKAESDLHAFTKALLNDLHALEQMLDAGSFESGVSRIGAEQEMFLVDRYMRPAPVAERVLEQANDARLTTEIARFNLEANLTPQDFSSDCLSRMERELEEVLQLTRAAARTCNADVLLTGILPTLEISDLRLDNLAPMPRYHAMNTALSRLCGGTFPIHIKGLDELHHTHDNVMMESCNTSFQVHLQTSPAEFVAAYNLAQAVTAPVLAAAVNSPLLLGKRLWQETRLALFQHSIEGRSQAQKTREAPKRVTFGKDWLKGSVLEIFQEDIARFRVILTTQLEEDSLEALARGMMPRLVALRLHNGTVWRWNRPCYGVAGGRAHLRIENRALPAGPTVVDEISNAAFFLGLMRSLDEEYGAIDERLSFDDAKANFFHAARFGLQAQFTWIDGKSYPATTLILEHLLPLARQGLKRQQVASEDIDRYLGTLEERVRSGQTGAQWTLRSLAALDGQGPCDVRQRTLVAAMLGRQQTNEPAHRWSLIESSETEDWRASYRTIGHFMSTDLFTVRPDDLADLAASVMSWQHVKHVPVEDDEGRLVGLISHRDLLRLLARGAHTKNGEHVTVRSIMKTDPVTVTPDTRTLEAIERMRQTGVGCLLVVNRENHLIGIVTAYDFLQVSAKLFEAYLTSDNSAD
jgi:CBS domain-containing protein/gamma-glutamyl:cysteine ligase YbdK (ATP-grasp superfamily)